MGMYSLLLCVCIIGELLNAQIAQYYFLEQFKDGGNLILASYPVKVCSRDGNLYSNVNSGQYVQYKCISPVIARAFDYGNDEITCPGSAQVGGTFYVNSTGLLNQHDYDCSDDSASRTINYMQFHTYAGQTDSPSGCPSDNSTFSFKYEYTFATGICMDQSGFDVNGSYMMMTCDETGGRFEIYNDNTCTDYVGLYRDIPFDCTYYFRKSGDAERYYHRFAHCYVNGTDVVMPSPAPTSDPSPQPTDYPTDEPTENPTEDPTDDPVTNAPTNEPTFEPTEEPTLEPTFVPSQEPTPEPTFKPSFEPTEAPIVSFDSGDGNKVPGSKQFLSSIDNLTFIEIVIVILFVFYLFICLYIWCNERRKRKSLATNFQQGQDRDARVAYLRQKNADRAQKLQLANGIPHEPVQQNSPNAHRQHLMREGM